MAAFERALYRAQEGRCFNCGQPMPPPRKNGQLPAAVNREHVTPRALGGAKGYPNLALSHLTCNRIKDDQPPTADQIARLAAINAQINRDDLIEAAAEEIEILHNPRLIDRLPGAGRLRTRAVEFLASALPQLSREDQIAAFKRAGAYGQGALPNGPAMPGDSSAQFPPVETSRYRAFPPDPLDFAHNAEPETPTRAKPRFILAAVGVVGFAASLAIAAPMIGFMRDALPLVDATWLAPAFLVAAIVLAVAARKHIGPRVVAIVLLLAAGIAALGLTSANLDARLAFQNLMEGNGLPWRLPGYANPLSLGALALGAVAWLMLAITSLTARAPVEA